MSELSEKLRALGKVMRPAVDMRLIWDAADEIERLHAIVDRLPRTADGVPIVPGMHLWLPGECYSIIALHFSEPVEREEGVFVVKIDTYRGWGWADCFYSTREAAELARNQSNG